MKRYFFTLCFVVILGAPIFACAQMRDPTRPPIKTLGFDKYGIKVDQILYGDNRKIAIVNGQSVKVGDLVSTVKVVSIDPDKVVFEGDEGTFPVSLYANIKKVSTEE